MTIFTINYIDADSPSFTGVPNAFTIGSAADIVSLTLDDDDGFLDVQGNDPGGTPGIAQNDSNPSGTTGFEPGETVQYFRAYSVSGSDGSTGTIYYMSNASGSGIQGIAADFPFVVGVTYTPGAQLPATSAPYETLAPCFTRGTLIKTDQGERPIEELAAGDMVLTMDHGYQPIRWIGSSKRAATGDLAPILIRKGALGNDRDLRVSPQHRMLLQGWQAELLFGELEVLATAKSLLNDHSILRDEGGEVEYFHMLFDTHEIIYAEGCRF